jgi:hypothetical protein
LSEENRIYVVVAETVQNKLNGQSTVQVCGRNMAQAAHVVSKMQVARCLNASEGYDTKDGHLIPCTTIVLAARDSAEMQHIKVLLSKSVYALTTFEDRNPEVYGSEEEILAAICTDPTTAESMIGILDYLPLWLHGRNCAGN